MNRVLFVGLLFTLAFTPAFSQTKNHPSKASANSVLVAQPPTVRGLKLGMTADELLAVFHDANDIKAKLARANGFPAFGALQVALQPADESAKEQLKGTEGIWLSFFDGRISSISIRYPPFPEGPDWTNVDALIMKFSESFGLPEASNWLAEPNDSQSKVLTGSGFVVRVTINGSASNFVRDTSTDSQRLVRERSAAYHEEKRRAFKP
jgi:hypothetical protein